MTRLRAIWRQYRKLVVFREPPRIEHPAIARLRERDPDDVPLVELVFALKAEVLLTKDNDFSATGLRRGASLSRERAPFAFSGGAGSRTRVRKCLVAAPTCMFGGFDLDLGCARRRALPRSSPSCWFAPAATSARQGLAH